MSDDTTEEVPEEEPVDEIDLRYGVPVTSSLDQDVLHCTVETYRATVEAIRDDGFLLLADTTAVDYSEFPGREVGPGITAERFELVVQLVDPMERRRLRLRVQVPESAPTVPTLYDLYPGCDYAEREVYDMFGIEFEGHPDPTRILMPEDWDGFPLRKDYSQGRIPVQFKSASNVR